MVDLVELQKTFYYSESSPSKLRWKEDKWTGQYRKTLTVVKDSPAGGMGHHGYYEVKTNGKSLKCHRIIYMLVNEVTLIPSEQIDHSDGDRGNNLSTNLLLSDATLNSRNKKIRENSATGITGVSISGNGQGGKYAKATWQELDGKGGCKTFSFMIYGEDLAIKMAIGCRRDNMIRLQNGGAGYSDRHLSGLMPCGILRESTSS